MSKGGRRLAPEEAALWARVVATVNPIRKGQDVKLPSREGASVADAPAPASPPPAPPASGRGKRVSSAPPSLSTPDKRKEAATLDASWDRRLSRGIVAPESSVDLHGHTLDSAYRLLDQGLERAIARGDRVLLLITGKPPRPESERPHARGAIRAAVGDWLAASRHSGSIAAVRGAHPRHGGAGALYIVLKRKRVPGGKS